MVMQAVLFLALLAVGIWALVSASSHSRQMRQLRDACDRLWWQGRLSVEEYRQLTGVPPPVPYGYVPTSAGVSSLQPPPVQQAPPAAPPAFGQDMPGGAGVGQPPPFVASYPPVPLQPGAQWQQQQAPLPQPVAPDPAGAFTTASTLQPAQPVAAPEAGQVPVGVAAGGYAAPGHGPAIPLPYMQPPPLPVREKKKINVVNVVLSVGVLLVLLAGLVFATTTWQRLSDWLRLGLLVGQTLVFFGASLLAERRFKLRNTGMAFYLLGCSFCFVSTMAAGFFELLGQWLSFGGPGADALFSLGLALTALAAGFGLWRYKTPLFIWLVAVTGQLSLSFAFHQLIGGRHGHAVAVAAIGCLIFVLFYLKPAGVPPKGVLQKHITNIALVSYFAWGAYSLLALEALPLGASNWQGLVVLAMLLTTLTWLAVQRRLKAGWYIHTVMLWLFIASICRVLLPRSEWQSVLQVALCCAAFWAYYLLGQRVAGGPRTQLSDVLFLGWAALRCLAATAGSDSPAAPLCNGLLLATLFGLALAAPLKSRLAVAAAWLTLPLGQLLLYAAGHWAQAGAAGVAPLWQVGLQYAWLPVYFGMALATSLLPSTARGKRLELPSAVGVLWYAVSSIWVAGRWPDLPAARWLPVASTGMLAVFCGLQLVLRRSGRAGTVAAWGGGVPLALLQGASVMLAGHMLATVLWPAEGNDLLRLLLLTVLVFVMLVLSVLRSRASHPEGGASVAFGWFCVAFSQLLLVASALAYGFGSRYPLWQGWVLIGCIAACYGALTLRRQSVFGLPGLAVGTPLLLVIALRMDGALPYGDYWFTGAWMLLLAAAGRLLYKRLWEIPLKGSWVIDWPGLLAAAVPLYWISRGDEIFHFAGLLLLAGWCFLFRRRLPFAHGDRMVYSLALAFLLMAVFWQPFAAWPKLLRTEVALVLWMVYAALLRFALWKNKPLQMNWMMLAALALCLLRQGVDVLLFGFLWDGAALGVLSVLPLLLYCWARQAKRPFPVDFSQVFGIFAVGASQVLPVVLFLMWHRTAPLWFGGLLVGLLALGCGMLHWQKLSMFAPALVPVANLYVFGAAERLSDHPLQDGLRAAAVLFLAFAVLGRLLHKKVYLPQQKWPKFDYFTLLNFIGPVMWAVQPDQTYHFVGLVLLAAWCAQFLWRIQFKNSNAWVATAVLVLLAAAFWRQPFVGWPRLLATEIHLLTLLAVALVLRFAIWRSKAEQMGWLLFGVTAFCFAWQGWDALWHGELWDALLLAIAALALFVSSMVVRRRKWFLLALVTLVTVVLYRTADFWSSLAWWVYLLAAGLLLIALAAANEGCRQKGSNIGKRLLSLQFFTQWKW